MACTLMTEVVPISKDGRSPENDRVNNSLGSGLFMATMPSCRVHSNSILRVKAMRVQEYF